MQKKDINIQDVIESLNNHDNDRSLSLLERLIRCHPEKYGLNYGKAIALLRSGRMGEAKEALEKLLFSSPNHQKAIELLREIKFNEIQSPLTGSTNVVLEKEIEIKFFVNIYKKFGIDVSKYFKNYDRVQIFRCLDTGFRFYFPFDLEGDGEFYGQLENFDWYYMDWKWEHEIAYSLISPGEKVLEIGCARGSFLNKLKSMGVHCTGLELNPNAAQIASKLGIDVKKQTINEHVHGNFETYDAVCAFEVLEHIAQVKDFLQCSIDALKFRGKLIIAVPNNDAYIFKADDIQALNRPPHHMGLWNIDSLVNLGKVFELRLDKIELEPLQKYHYNYCFSLVINNIIKHHGQKGLQMVKQNKDLILTVAQEIFQRSSGHTIFVSYSKC